MKVKCIKKKYVTDSSPVLFLPYPVSCNEDDYISFSHGDSVDDGVIYSLQIGAEYMVYGIMEYDNTIYYLISFEEMVMPDWIPSDLFEIKDNTIPCFWIYENKFINNPNIAFILSHYEIATDLNHMLRLLQGYSSDFKDFQKNMADY